MYSSTPRSPWNGQCSSWVLPTIACSWPARHAGIEKIAGVHPGLGPFEHLLGISLRHDALADAETPNVDLVVKPLWNLLGEVALVPLGLHVNVGLGPDQRVDITLDIGGIHVA